MEMLDRIYDKVYCEIEDIGKKEKLQMADVEALYKLVDIMKDIDEIEMSQDGMYSNTGRSYNNGNSYMRGRSNRGSSYRNGSSYARGNSYSRDDSKDMMLDHLQDIMDMAVDDRDRKAIEKLMSQMQQN